MRRLLALLILAAAIGGFLFLKASRPSTPAVEARERVWRIAVDEVRPQSLQPTLTLYGRVESPDRVRMTAPLGGRVDQVAVRDGDRVAAGAVLLRLDQRDLAPRLETARAEVERETLRLRHDRESLEQERQLLVLAQARLDRAAKLSTARLGSESAVDQVREDVARMRLQITQREQAIAEHPARLAQAQARLAEVERDTARAELVAAFDARIATVEVAEGDQVQPGQALLTLYPEDALYLRATLPAAYAPELNAALAAGERLSARAEFGQAPITLTLERIAGEADARGVEVLLRLDRSQQVPLGAFINAELTRPPAHDVLALPFAALHGGDRIYQVVDGRLKSVRVERVGERRIDGEARLIVRVPGLSPGDLVMVNHLPNAIDGLSVEVVAR